MKKVILFLIFLIIMSAQCVCSAEISLENAALYDEFGMRIKEYQEADAVTISFDLVNNGDTLETGTVIAATHNAEKLIIGISQSSFSVRAGEKQSINLSLATGGENVEIMIWDSIQHMKPYQEKQIPKITYSSLIVNETFESAVSTIWTSVNECETVSEECDNRWMSFSGDNSEFSADGKYTDFKIELDFLPEQEFDGSFQLNIRNRELSYFGEHCYLVGFSDSNTVSIIKRSFDKYRTVDKVLAKAEMQIPETVTQMCIMAEDNNISLYINDELVLSAGDNVSILLDGGFGIETNNACVWIDNVCVTSIYDETGGVYDNFLSGGFNESTKLVKKLYACDLKP